MRPTKKRLTGLITTIMITALLLTGAVPSFAWGAQTQHDSVVLPAVTIDDSDAPGINGTSAIMMDIDTGTVIYEKKANNVVEPASLTKILNCLVVLETLDLDEVVTVPSNVETEGSLMWLNPGEKLTVRDLIYGMMLVSGNDAAQVLGLAASGGDLNKFSDMMNERARKCGADHTDFKNPNGLNEDKTKLNYTSARDLALITREAMKKPFFRKVVKTAKYTVPKTNKSDKRKLYNSNLCLWQKYETIEINGKDIPYKYKGCNGVKTGFTSDAGYCLVGSAKRKGTGFVVVTLGSEEGDGRYEDAIRLWDYAFDKYETDIVLKAGKTAGVQRVWGGEKRNVAVGTQRDLGVTIYKGTADQMEFTTDFRLDADKVDAPIKKGQQVGEALVFNENGRLVGKEGLYALAAVAEGGPLSHIGIADEDVPMALGIAGGVVALILLLILIHAIRKKKATRKKREAMRGELSTMRTAGTGMTARELTDVTGVEEYVPIPKGPARISNEELTAWRSTDQKPSPSRTGKRFGGQTPRGGYGKDAPPSGRGASGRGDVRRRSRSAGTSAGAPNAGMRNPGAPNAGAPNAGTPNAGKAPRMNITPRTPFTAGAPEQGAGQPTTRAPFTAGAPEQGADRGASQPLHGNGSARGETPRDAGYRVRSAGSMSDEELFSALESTEVYDANQPRRHGKLTDEEWAEVMRRTKRSWPKEPKK